MQAKACLESRWHRSSAWLPTPPEKASIHITIDPVFHLSALSQAVEGHLTDLRVGLRSLEDGSFKTKAAASRPGGFLNFSFELPDAPDAARARLTSRCFINVVGELITYLDRMIAFRRFTSRKDVPWPTEVRTQEELLAWVERQLEDEYKAVARNQGLKNPDKIRSFPGIMEVALDSALSYFSIRRCVEHHGGRPQEELTLRYPRLRLLFAGVEAKPGMPGPVGVGLDLGMGYESRALPPGEPVALTEEELEHAVFTIQNLQCVPSCSPNFVDGGHVGVARRGRARPPWLRAYGWEVDAG